DQRHRHADVGGAAAVLGAVDDVGVVDGDDGAGAGVDHGAAAAAAEHVGVVGHAVVADARDPARRDLLGGHTRRRGEVVTLLMQQGDGPLGGQDAVVDAQDAIG